MGRVKADSASVKRCGALYEKHKDGGKNHVQAMDAICGETGYTYRTVETYVWRYVTSRAARKAWIAAKAESPVCGTEIEVPAFAVLTSPVTQSVAEAQEEEGLSGGMTAFIYGSIAMAIGVTIYLVAHR